MKLLHGADLHLDSPMSATPELRAQLLQIPNKLAALCRREGCDAVLLAGDLFDGKWSRQSFDTLCGALEKMAVPVFISPGNHDCLSVHSPYFTEKWPDNVHIFTEERITSVAVPALDLRIYGAGYRSMDCDALLEGFCAEGTERYHVGLLHGDPTRVDSPYSPVTAAQVRESGLDYLALGHVHKGGQFRAGDTLCAWPGCPMGRGYDEAGPKGVLIVTLEDTVQAEFVPLDVPCFYDLQIPATALDSVLPAAGNNHYYRITLTGEREPMDLNGICARFPNLELLDHTLPATDIWGNADADSLEGVFFRILRRHEDEAVRERAAQIARAVLDGREVTL